MRCIWEGIAFRSPSIYFASCTLWIISRLSVFSMQCTSLCVTWNSLRMPFKSIKLTCINTSNGPFNLYFSDLICEFNEYHGVWKSLQIVGLTSARWLSELHSISRLRFKIQLNEWSRNESHFVNVNWCNACRRKRKRISVWKPHVWITIIHWPLPSTPLKNT